MTNSVSQHCLNCEDFARRLEAEKERIGVALHLLDRTKQELEQVWLALHGTPPDHWARNAPDHGLTLTPQAEPSPFGGDKG